MLRELESPAEALAAEFFSPEGKFAATTFDALPNNPADAFTAEDLLAVTLLDVALSPRALRQLLESRSAEFARLLRDIPADLDLWEATDAHLAAIDRCDAALRTLPGVGETRASKLMARKRPRLVPVVDSVIRHALRLGVDSRRELRDCLNDPAIRVAIERSRPKSASAGLISSLRLVDAVVWIRHSRSRNARQARLRAGLSIR
ncbi:DUF6308 family protein [Mycolicibacterium elephantis]|uniref:DUF6308 family protein n=1 Tax=Mycolicibacterium elephantis TaxID=81858 RepID=UPI0039B74354